MRVLKRVTVFAGASSPKDGSYLEAAKALGEEMARRKIGYESNLLSLW
jgi:predicted Rossmann-fold nucleotide-binding protein